MLGSLNIPEAEERAREMSYGLGQKAACCRMAKDFLALLAEYRAVLHEVGLTND
jgi:hypothetical protein